VCKSTFSSHCGSSASGISQSITGNSSPFIPVLRQRLCPNFYVFTCAPTSKGSDDNRSLFIKGDAVNRPFVYNFLDPDAVRLLKRDGFIKVTFMRHSMGDWVAEYDVQSGKITWD
jgi:hypothetical protein